MLRPDLFRATTLTLAALLVCAPAASRAQTPKTQAAQPAAGVPTQIQQLASELIAAKTEEERGALLDSRRDSLSTELRKHLSETGDRLRVKGEYGPALAAHESALAVATRLGDKVGIARALNGVGQVRFAKNDLGGAMESYKGSLAAWAAVEERAAGRAEVLTDIARIYFRKRDFKQSQEFYEKALEAARVTGDQEFEAAALNGLGIVKHYTGETGPALQLYRQSLELAEKLGNKERTGNALNNLAMIHRLRGEPELASEMYRRSIRTFEEMGDKARLALALSNFSTFLQSSDDYSSSLRHLQRSLTLYEELGDKPGVARVLNNLSVTYFKQGNHPLALDFGLRSLAIKEEDKTEGNRETLSPVLNGIAETYLAMGRYDDALQSATRSLALAETTRQKRNIIGALEQVGAAYFAKGDYAAARERWEKSLLVAEQSDNQDYGAIQLDKLATAHFALKDYAKAFETATRAARAAAQTGRRSVAWSAHTTAGKSLLALNRKTEARREFEAAIDTIESLRGQIVGAENEQQNFFANKTAPYDEMVKLLVAEKSDTEALRFAERAKARVLFDVLHKGRADVSKTMTDAERARESSLRGDISALNSQLQQEAARPSPDAARTDDLRQRLGKARLEHAAFQTNLYAAHPELKVQRGELPTVSSEQLAALLPDERTALVEYAITDDRTFLFVLTKDQQPAAEDAGRPQNAETPRAAMGAASASVNLRVYTLDITRAELAGSVERFRQQLATRDILFGAAAKRLHALLLAPAAAQLETRARLVIIPDGALWELPFQALQTSNDEYVVERHAVSYAPSLSVLTEIVRARGRRKSPTAHASGLLAFGNPALGARDGTDAGTKEGGAKSGRASLQSATFADLPEAERQVRALGALYGAARSRVYTGAEAGEASLKREAGRYTVLHLATHGVLDDSNPMYSYLMLAGSATRARAGGDMNAHKAAGRGNLEKGGNGVGVPNVSDAGAGEDGLLEAWELMELDLGARLVVLSACETARGRVSSGEGLIGLTWALFVAGSPATVVSQWKVESASTTELMLGFHRNLLAKSSRRAAPHTTRGESHALSKAEALRQASLALLRGEKYSHPFYWAGFVIVGDGD